MLWNTVVKASGRLSNKTRGPLQFPEEARPQPLTSLKSFACPLVRW